jgi:hypothetical protein
MTKLKTIIIRVDVFFFLNISIVVKFNQNKMKYDIYICITFYEKKNINNNNNN